MSDDLIIPSPGKAPARQLVLLFHGVGASPEGLVALGQALARPGRQVVAVRSPQLCDLGSGWMWFSVQGITEANRAERVAEALPGFVTTVRQWQQRCGVPPEATTLAGFSQGAIMSLEATQLPGPLLAGRVVSLSGRFARPPRQAPEGASFQFIHGQQDPVIAPMHSVDGAAQLKTLGALSVQCDVLHGLGHGIDARVLALLQDPLDAALAHQP